MASIQKLQKLSGAHCVLLAAHYATESNITALRALTTLRDADLPLDLTLSILLTYLPEELDPSSYVEYLNELATGSRDAGPDPAAAVDVSAVEELSVSRAKKKRKGLELVPVVNPLYAVETDLDLFSHFLINRAHRIDAQTGLLDLIPQLVVPFLGHSEYLRTWFISTVLPLLRLSYEYYPQNPTKSLEDFAKLQGRQSIDYQLSNVRHATGSDINYIARDLKGVVSPWMCGANERKRRKLSGGGARRGSIVEQEPQESDDWSNLFQWLLHTAKDNLELATVAFSEWDGPEDMDLGGFEEGRDYVDDEQQRGLEIQYAQAAMASLYIGEKSDVATLQTACKLLKRICGLLNYDPPPDLHISVESLPSYELKDSLLSKCTLASLREERLLSTDCLLTRPGEDSVQIAKLILFSAVVLSSLQQPISLREICKIILRQDKNEQFSLLQRILHKLVTSSKDNDQWSTFRLKILWLWNWRVEKHGEKSHVQGVLGQLEGSTVESEILKALIENSRYDLAVQIYIRPSPGRTPLPLPTVEQIALSSALHHYDNASNGNRTRGGMKRAYDIVGAFAPHFEKSSRFQRMQALLKATNALSYYSLILQHGVPFQPVNIRVSANPLSLIRKLLSQNKGSYTKLDDLIAIGQNLVTSRPSTLMDEDDSAAAMDQASLEQKETATERRVTGMAIEAALEEDDFETAYSYVVNRLSPSDPSPTPSITQKDFSFHPKDTESDDSSTEDIAWRAALRAGRYNAQPPPSDPWAAPAASSTIARPALRQLEQRMELLSQALLLAPPNHLEEVLKVWQDCEAEMISLLAQDAEQEQRFNDAADRKLPGTFISDTITVQPRREVGRGAAEEAPMGLFDVARGAAAAFSKSAFPLHGARSASNPKGGDGGSMSSSRVSLDTDEASLHGEDRVRKRDMVATVASGALNTGTGALASGLGWMLGAKPVNEQERH